MRVDLIAHTVIVPGPMERHGFTSQPSAAETDSLAEFAGRSCYESFHRPNDATARNRDYIAHILEVGHLSVLEHSSATFYITGVSRALTHEFVRHRHFSYSQRSQRYVDESTAETVIPPDYVNIETAKLQVGTAHRDAKRTYESLVKAGEADGLTRKRARQAARAVLPNANETRIVVTGNMRAWLEFLGKRWNQAADEEFQQLAGLILDELRNVAPAAVQNVPDVPYDGSPSYDRAAARKRLLEQGMTYTAVDEVLHALYGAKT